MSTTPPPAATIAGRWSAFWFGPQDPTTLGFIRVTTGLLILYIHLAHSLDLQAFFGKNGWYNHAYMERERREYPWAVASFTDWTNDEVVMPRLPEYPHRRQAVMRFVRGLPGRPADRAATLRFLQSTAAEPPATSQATLTFLLGLVQTGKGQEARVAAALDDGRQLYLEQRDGQIEYRDKANELGTSATLFPPHLLAKPADERKAAAADLRALVAALPTGADEAEYLFNHLMELDPRGRQVLIQYLIDLPEDEAARTRLVDYLDYWNNDPRKLHHQGQRLVSVWFHVTDPGAMAAVHAATLVLIVLFTFGVCTRVTGVLTWIAVVGYLHRTNQILFGMDTMMNILLIYLVVGDSGAALSVDRLVARYRAVRASLARTGTIDAGTRAFLDRPPPSSGAGLGVRLIQIHFCFIYLAAGLSKLKGPGWWNGQAFWDVMVNPEFTLMRYAWFEEFVRGLASVKPLYHAGAAFGVWFTWGLEVSFPFLVWTRLRPVYVWMGVLLHAGIGVLMGLNVFELLMMVMLLAFFPAGVIRDRLRGGPGLPRLGFAYDPADPKQARAAALAAAADVDGQLTLEAKPGAAPPPAPTVFGALRLLRPLRAVLWVPGLGGWLAGRLSPAKA